MKPSAKIRRRMSRENRRREWAAAKAAFILAGGHVSRIVPFHMNWRQRFAIMEADIAGGGKRYTLPYDAWGDMQYGYKYTA